jgi:hypothetical protein
VIPVLVYPDVQAAVDWATAAANIVTHEIKARVEFDR